MAKTKTTDLLGLLFLLSFLASPVYAEGVDKKPEEPVNITSKQMEADKKAGTVVFRGNVVVRQNDGIIMSELLTVYYDGNNNMEKIVAEGDVRINHGDRVGTCQFATYYPGDKSIKMEDNPRIWRGGDIIEGEVIILFMDSERMVVEGGAKAVMNKSEENRKDESHDTGSKGQ